MIVHDEGLEIVWVVFVKGPEQWSYRKLLLCLGLFQCCFLLKLLTLAAQLLFFVLGL